MRKPLKGSSTSKASTEAHWRQAAISLGEDPDEFVKRHRKEDTPDEPPLALAWQWSIFQEMTSSREGSFNGPQRLSYREIRAFVQLMEIDFRPWEVRLFRNLDTTYLNVMNE